MSLLMMDGGEDGLTGYKGWSGGGYGLITSPVRSGVRAISLVNKNVMIWAIPAVNEHATVIVGFAGYFAGYDDSDWGWVSLRAEGIGHVEVRWRSDGRYDLYTAGVLRGTSVEQYVPGVWYFYELKATLADAGGYAEFRRDNNVLLSFTGDTKAGGTKTTFDAVGFHGLSQNADPPIYLDDIYIANGAGTLNNDFLGDIRVLSFFPNGNGALNQLMGSDGNQTDNFLLVDESPDPNTTDYVESATVGQMDTYPFGDAAAGSIRAVVVRAWAAKSDAGDRSMRTITRVGGTNYTGATVGLGTSFSPLSTLHEVNPATGAAWTVAAFNGAEFGVEVR